MESKQSNSVLLLQEPPLHPQSVVSNLKGRFERPSTIHVVTKDGLRFINTPPIYDDKYLVLFDDMKIFDDNISYLRLDIMFVVVVCSSKGILEDCVSLCKDKSIDYVVYVNKFEKSDANLMIHELATEKVSEAFCKALISRVGLSPQRIISAMMVCEQVGYKTSNITKYVDKYVYIAVQDVVESLLHICKSKAQVRRAATYLHMNRLWFGKYTRNVILHELDLLIKLFMHSLDGTLTAYNIAEYSEEYRVPRYKIMYARNLMESKSLSELMVVRQIVTKASLLELTMQLS